MPKDNILHKGLVPAEKALYLILEGAAPTQSELLPLVECNGRVLAKDYSALRTQPPFSASAMDGYAVRHADLNETVTNLKLVGESAAGHPFDGKVSANECARIFTGAPVPDGADTIIIQENVKADGDHIKVLEPAPLGKFVRQAGLDFKAGDKLLLKNHILNAQSISLAASMDHPTLEVYCRPKVSIIATGDELVLPGKTTLDGQIIASNTFGIQAIAKEAGANVADSGIASDTFEALYHSISSQLDNGADLIVTSGGASVGDHDLVKPVMEKLGFTFSFVKIAMRPGKPVIFGKATIGGKERRFLGLAGNPVSSLVSSHIFLKPLIQLMSGLPAQTAEPVSATLDHDLPANDERQDYLRGNASRDANGKLRITAFEKQDSSMLATLNKAECLLIRAAHAPAAKKGDSVQIIWMNGNS